MAYIGLKFGRHSIQTSRWNGELAVEAAMPRLQKGATWRPTLALGDDGPHWGHDVWRRISELLLAPVSLLEHLSEEDARVRTWLPNPQVLLDVLWTQLEEIGAKAMRDEEQHVLCVASTAPVTEALRRVLPRLSHTRLRLPPELIVDASACSLVAAQNRPQSPTLLNGPVLHLHLGGREAQVHLWETEGAERRQIFHRVSHHTAAGASVGEILDSLYRRIKTPVERGGWGWLVVDETADELAVSKIRRHVLYHLSEQRAQWTQAWQYRVPMGYEQEAQWLPRSPVRIPEAELQALLKQAGDALMETVGSVLAGNSLHRRDLAAVVVTGAGATGAYLDARLREEFQGFNLATKPEIVPAHGAARLAYYNGSPDSPHRIEIRDGLNIGAELAEGAFDVLISEKDFEWGERLRVYDVPPGTTELCLRGGIRRARMDIPELARVPLPPATSGTAAVVLRVWRKQHEWYAEAIRRTDGTRTEPVRLSLPAR